MNAILLWLFALMGIIIAIFGSDIEHRAIYFLASMLCACGASITDEIRGMK